MGVVGFGWGPARLRSRWTGLVGNCDLNAVFLSLMGREG